MRGDEMTVGVIAGSTTGQQGRRPGPHRPRSHYGSQGRARHLPDQVVGRGCSRSFAGKTDMPADLSRST